ncbi:MAG: tRNA-dihydrouridine synthase family protein, partial [Bdellovibrionales bacterium]|nr:tRNA-dihydrouridine synthase family protein [Bdellovibrionales bacterium]
RLQEEWGASGIDINMGCPVRKALSHNYGVSLMGDAGYAAEIVKMTVRHTTLPVSVKLRAGPKGAGQEASEASGASAPGAAGLDFLLRFADGLVQAGAESLTLHPRTAEQKRRGLADWEQIRVLRESVPVAIIGNGDVQTADDVFRMLEQTSCDAVMVGRALTARPWLLWQVGERLGWPEPPGQEGRKAPATPEEEGVEYGRALLKLIDNLVEFHPPTEKANWSEDLLIRKARFYLKNSCPWIGFGHELEARASKAKSMVELRQTVEHFFGGAYGVHTMSPRTDLRY